MCAPEGSHLHAACPDSCTVHRCTGLWSHIRVGFVLGRVWVSNCYCYQQSHANCEKATEVRREFHVFLTNKNISFKIKRVFLIELITAVIHYSVVRILPSFFYLHLINGTVTSTACSQSVYFVILLLGEQLRLKSFQEISVAQFLVFELVLKVLINMRWEFWLFTARCIFHQ